MKQKFSKPFVAAFSWLILAQLSLHAGAGHDHGPVPGENTNATSGPVQITAQAKENLQLETVQVEVKALEKTLFAIGQMDAIPEKQSQISSRIAGQVKQLFVAEGQYVEEGELLATVESRLPGDPPPVIEFHAPQSGTITNLHVFKGTNIEPNAHLMDVIDLNYVYARAQVYEGQVAGLKLGQKARIRLEAYADQVFVGVLERLSSAVNEESRTLSAWFRVENPEQLIRLNMRATFDIILEEINASTVVPKEAILGQNGNFFVFVVKDQEHFIYEKTSVVVGLSDDRFVGIKEGISPSNYVVTKGNYQLQYLPTMSADEFAEHAEEHDDHDHDHGHAELVEGDLDESRWFELLEETDTDHDEHSHDDHAHEHGSEDHDHEHDAHDHSASEEESHLDEHDHSHMAKVENPKQVYWESVFRGLFILSILLNIGFVIAWARRGRLSHIEAEEE